MAMNGNARGQAQYDAVAGENANWAKLNNTEKAALLAHLQLIWGTDVTYLAANVDVQQSAHSGTNLRAVTSIPVTVNTSTGIGATTSPGTIEGKGSIV